MTNILKKNWNMCQIGNITSALPRNKNTWDILIVCVGVVLLKQWKQGYTCFCKI